MMTFVSNGCFKTNTLFTNEGHGYGVASSVGHLRSDSVLLLVYDGMRSISEEPVLYYKSLEITLTLLRQGVNIL
jgi:hypothetical protein